MMLNDQEKALLGKAIELFKNCEPTDDVEVTLDWTSGNLANSMDYVLDGTFEDMVNDTLHTEYDLFDDTNAWLAEVTQNIRRELDGELDGSIEQEAMADNVIAELMRMINEGEIDFPSCSPVCNENTTINLVMNFHKNQSDDLSGLALWARTLGLQHPLLLSAMPKAVPGYAKYLSTQSIPEDFIENSALPDGALTSLADSRVLDTDIGLCLPLTYGELKEISRRIGEGESFELKVKNPVGTTYDGGSDSHWSDAERIFSDGYTIAISEALFRSEAVSFVMDEDRAYIEHARPTSISITGPSSTKAVSGEDIFRHKLVTAILSGDTEKVDTVIGDSGYLFKEMALNDGILGWNPMHYAAMIDDQEDCEAMLRHLAQLRVNPDDQSPMARLCPIDIAMGSEWLAIVSEDDDDNTMNISDAGLQLLVDIGATKSLNIDISRMLSDEDNASLSAKRLVKQNQDLVVNTKRNSMRM